MLLTSLFWAYISTTSILLFAISKPDQHEKGRFTGLFYGIFTVLTLYLYYYFEEITTFIAIFFIISQILGYFFGGMLITKKYKNPSAIQAIHGAFTSLNALFPAALYCKISLSISIIASISIVCFSLACGIGSYYYLRSQKSPEIDAF